MKDYEWTLVMKANELLMDAQRVIKQQEELITLQRNLIHDQALLIATLKERTSKPESFHWSVRSRREHGEKI